MRKRKESLSFAERLTAWVEQQPETPAIRSAPRSVRKAMAREGGVILTRVPGEGSPGLNRKQRRTVTRDIMRRAGDARTVFSRRQARILAQARRDQRRSLSLSMKRLAFLEERKAQQEAAQAAYLTKQREDLGLDDAVQQGD